MQYMRPEGEREAALPGETGRGKKGLTSIRPQLKGLSHVSEADEVTHINRALVREHIIRWVQVHNHRSAVCRHTELGYTRAPSPRPPPTHRSMLFRNWHMPLQ